MRFCFSRLSTLGVLMLPLMASSCAAPSWPSPPVPAQLTDAQAADLADTWLDRQPIAMPRTLVAEEKQCRGWWLRYEGPFDPAARPPQASYLLEVNNDGAVRQID